MESCTFRSPLALRAVLTLFGTVSAIAAILAVSSGVKHRSGSLIGAGVLLTPAVLAAAAWQRRIVAGADELLSYSLLGVRRVRWEQVRRVDRSTTSFTVESELGPVSAGWLARPDREALLKLIIERAKLAESNQEPRWGLIAQYVPRRQDIQFVPHHRRAKTEKPAGLDPTS